VDDVAVVTSIDLERGFIEKSIGSKVPLKVMRDKGRVDVELVLASTKIAVVAPGELVWRKLGVKLNVVGADTVAKANPLLHGGLLVSDVASGSAAAAAGIQKGDILVGLHLWETLNPDNVAFVLNHKDFATFQPLRFYLARDGKLRDGWINNIP
jgi:serine protease Do